MARPAKNHCDYFPHDAGMRNHKKVKAIRSKFGITGYAIWSMILEHLTGNDGNVFAYSDLEFELMSGDFGVSATEIRDVVDYCIKLELLFNVEGFVKSESLDERLAPVYIKRGLSKQQSAQQRRENGKFTTETTGSTVFSVTGMPQSKVKEIELKESRVNESKENIYITVSDEIVNDPLQLLEFYAVQLNGMERENHNIAWRPLVKEWFADHAEESFNDQNHVKNSFKKFYLYRETKKKPSAEKVNPYKIQ